MPMFISGKPFLEFKEEQTLLQIGANMEPKIPLFSVSQNWKKIFSNESFRSLYIDAALQRCSYEKVLWKYPKNLQENTHAKVRFQ